MKAKLLLLAAVCAAAPAWGVESGVIPGAFPSSRYERMIEKSPFALATAPTAPLVADKTFADGWHVTGLARFDGKDFVTIKSRDLGVQFSLFGEEPNKSNGVKLQRVEWSPRPRGSTVMIEKEGQSAKVEFSQEPDAPVQMAPPGAGVVRSASNPAIKPSPNFLPQPNPSQPRVSIPRPSNQPVNIVTPAGGTVTGAGSRPAAPAAPVEGRRRLRVIGNGPTQ